MKSIPHDRPGSLVENMSMKKSLSDVIVAIGFVAGCNIFIKICYQDSCYIVELLLNIKA